MKTIKNILNKIIVPFSSRYYYKKEQTELQKKRLEVCKGCKYNSDNVTEKRFKDRFFMFLNNSVNYLFNISTSDTSVCTLCGCDLRFKSLQTDKSNMCEIGKWDHIK